MPRLVAGGPGKRKIWHGWVSGKSLIVKFGKMGQTLQNQVKEFDTEAAAQKALQKLVKQKFANEYTDNAWTLTLEESGLRLLEVVDLLPTPEDASVAYDDVSLHEGSWSGAFWHADVTFGLDKIGEEYRAGLIDRSGGSATWRPFAPSVTGTSFPSAFDSAGARFIVSTGTGPVILFDCKTLARSVVTPSGEGVVAVAFTAELVAVLRGKGTNTRLELYAAKGNAWSLHQTIACNRQDALFPFGAGRGLIVGWEPGDEKYDSETREWPATHVLGFDGQKVRLLGTFGLSVNYAFEAAGRSMFANNAMGLIEIHDLDAAIANASGKPEPTSLV